MKVILPKFDSKDTIDLAALTEDYFVVAYVDEKPFGVLMTNGENIEYWIQCTMSYDSCVYKFDTIYDTIEHFIKQYPNATFEAYE